MRLLRKDTSAREENGQGQSLVETAIILPLILVMLGGLMEFGVALFTYIGIVNAANAGAMYASSGAYAWKDVTTIQSRAQHAGNLDECADSQISPVRVSTASDDLGEMMVTVQVSCDLANVLPVSGEHLPITSTVTRKVRMAP